jgi:hypothetical protein
VSANDDYEAFAERFYKKFGFLPLGKDDPCRPSSETILARLGETLGELERAESAVHTYNTGSPKLPCAKCGSPGVVICGGCFGEVLGEAFKQAWQLRAST